LKRPQKVRVLGRDITFTYPKEGGLDLEEYGKFTLGTLSISVQDGLPAALEREVVLHELLHAIDHSMDLGLSERHINSLGVLIMHMLSDNPDLLRYLSGK